MRYRVDNFPILLRPFFLLFSWFLGLLMYGTGLFLHLTCRFRFHGKENLQGRTNFIFCFWHDSVFPYFAAFLRHERPHIWMNHAAWYMKPIHVMIRLVGVKGLVLGSTGHEGQEAAKRLTGYLRNGFSTVILPDGPSGPPRVLRKGALHISLAAGVPIVPMKIATSRCFVLKKSWDGKRLPLPFSTIEVIYEKPILVTEDNFQASETDLAAALS